MLGSPLSHILLGATRFRSRRVSLHACAPQPVARAYSTVPKKKLPKPKKVVKKKAPKNEEPIDPQHPAPAEYHIKDLLGLSHANSSALFRDAKLESKVSGLFQDTFQLGNREPSPALHQDDLRLKEETMSAKQRLTLRLEEIRRENPALWYVNPHELTALTSIELFEVVTRRVHISHSLHAQGPDLRFHDGTESTRSKRQSAGESRRWRCAWLFYSLGRRSLRHPTTLQGDWRKSKGGRGNKPGC